MSESADATLPGESGIHRFLDRSLLGLEWGGVAAILLVTLLQPTTGRTGLPTWGLVLLFAAYLLLVDLLRNNLRPLHPFTLKYVLGVPVSALIYYLGSEPGGPLFVLFFLAVVCATATLSLRGSLYYAASVATLTLVIDPTFPQWSPARGDVRDLSARLVLLATFAAGTAILRRRLMMEQETARSARGEAERLEELDRLRMDFVSSVSHDLRTPLTSVRAGLGLLEASAFQRLRTDEGELLRNARRNTDWLSMLIDDLLAYNQLVAGTLRADRQPLDMRAVVTDAMASVHPLIQEKGQTLEVDLPGQLAISGDPRQVEQVIVNLLGNASRHTPRGTRIMISGRVVGGEVLLTVRDNGPGIPAEHLERIFERFHRVHSAEAGSGLGLAIVSGIVNLHGGRVWAESEPGTGAAFHVALPPLASVGPGCR